MNLMKKLLLISLTFSLIFCRISTEAVEFEENQITSDLQQFTFKTSKAPMIVLIAENEKFNTNSNDDTILTVFDSLHKESKEYTLGPNLHCILDGDPNSGNAEYLIQFKNYKGGKFIIFNTANVYPLKQFEKGFNLYYSFTGEEKELSLTFMTDTLQEDIFLDIYPGEKAKVKKLSDTGDEYLQIKNNIIELAKGSKYQIDFYEKSKLTEFGIKKEN